MNIENIIDGIELADVALTALCGSAAVSEALPFMTKIKSNSILQLGFNILKMIAGTLKKKK